MSQFASNNRIQTTTRYKLMPMWVDAVLNSNVFASRILRAAKKWSGSQMKFPVKYAKNTTGQSFSGYDTFSTSSTDNAVNLTFDPKFYQITSSLPLDEVWVNQSSDKTEGILNLIAQRLVSDAQDGADDIGTMFYADGTGNIGKDFLGLGAIVDDGTSVATFGGLSRATYPVIAATSTASGGSLSLAKMSTLYNAITSGSQKPTVGLTTETGFSLYEQLLQPQERIAKDVSMLKGKNVGLNGGQGLIGGTGFTGLFYKGFPILADEKCTSGVLFFLNEDFINFYAVEPKEGAEPIPYKSADIEGNDYSNVMGLGFAWSGWVKPTNAAAIVGHIYLGGELICDNPKRQGKLTGITSV